MKSSTLVKAAQKIQDDKLRDSVEYAIYAIGIFYGLRRYFFKIRSNLPLVLTVLVLIGIVVVYFYNSNKKHTENMTESIKVQEIQPEPLVNKYFVSNTQTPIESNVS